MINIFITRLRIKFFVVGQKSGVRKSILDRNKILDAERRIKAFERITK